MNPDFRDTVQKTVTTLINTLTSTPNDRSPGTPRPLYTPSPTTAPPGQPGAPGSTAPREPTTPPSRLTRNQTAPCRPRRPGIGHPAPAPAPAPAEPSFVPPAVPGRNADPVPAPAPSRPAAPAGSTRSPCRPRAAKPPSTRAARNQLGLNLACTSSSVNAWDGYFRTRLRTHGCGFQMGRALWHFVPPARKLVARRAAVRAYLAN
ncbi:hypothetical protein AHiyo8_00210 [Arthrobacter sp. Hiyo8]|nr:hypothetical protein AHiyo8_00210 [Arthrobacter sp. Hiyo8]